MALDWQSEGACRSVINPDTGEALNHVERIAIFFPEKEGIVHPLAFQTCAGCSVIDQCREWSILNQPYGYSGGMDERERAIQRAGRGIWLRDTKDSNYKVTEIPCPSARGYKMHLRRGQRIPTIENGGCGCLEEHRRMTQEAKARLRMARKTTI